MSATPSPTSAARRGYPLWKRLLKIAAWTVMAIILAVVAALICLVNVLTPDKLTPLVNKAANSYLQADVSVGRVELSLRKSFPFLDFDIDSLTIVSRAMRSLPDSTAVRLPAYADTLLTLKKVHGGVNVMALTRGTVQISDVVIERPGVNIVVVGPGVNNFAILPESTDTTTTTDTAMPDVELRRFDIIDPQPIRYDNIAENSHAEIIFERLRFEGEHKALYRFAIGGDLNTPVLSRFNLSRFPFALDGNIRWNPEHPAHIGLDDFSIAMAYVNARLSTGLDFGRDFIVENLSVAVEPVKVADIVATIPEEMRRDYGLDHGFETDATVALTFDTDKPFNTATDSIPSGHVTVTVPECSLSYGKAHLNRLAIDIDATLAGNDADLAVVRLKRFVAAGPATTIELDGEAGNLMSDPRFEGRVDAEIELSRLPEVLTRYIDGMLTGRISAHADVGGRMSMLNEYSLHKLSIEGDVDADRLYWLSSDTVNMAYVNHACLTFGTQRKAKTGAKVLSAKLIADSAAILHSDLSMHMTDFELAAGVINTARPSDTTRVVPMGGGLKVGRFNLLTLTDSALVRVRDLDGFLMMRRFKGDAHLPEFVLDGNVRRISAGNLDTRLMLSRNTIHIDAHKLPAQHKRARGRQVKALADSIATARPDLPMDSVYAIAIERRRRQHHRYPRIHPEITEQDKMEIIDWGTSNTFRRILLDWAVSGSVKGERAGLFTPLFPVRNRLRDLNITFNNDSVLLTNVKYKAGHSDFLISGRISNLRRSLTSRGFRSPLKINFDVLSDTIDVNQLADLAFTGAAYAERKASQQLHRMTISDDEAQLERELGKIVQNAPDSMAPLLIPTNVSANISLRARNVLYSDLLLHDLNGTVMSYDGALSLNNLNATSDVGSIDLSALYSAPAIKDMKFGFGMKVNDFNIEKFLRLVPAVDSVLPLMRDISGIINADIAATVDIDRNMNLVLPTLDAAVGISGDNLVLLDAATYRNLAKWLLFKDKKHNVINHMDVKFLIRDNRLSVFPFMFDLDRYRIGVQGYNDLDMNFNYHLAILRSPLPFKFGINVSGNPDKFKVRFGKARFNQETAASADIVDTTRINLLEQIRSVFSRGVTIARFARLNIDRRPTAAAIDLATDTLTHADSLQLIREGLIPAPPAPPADETAAPVKDKKKEKGKKSRSKGDRKHDADAASETRRRNTSIR